MKIQKSQKKNKLTLNHVSSPRDTLLLGGVDFCSLTIHKSCFKKTGKFNEKNTTMQDVEMSLKLSKYFSYYFNKKSYIYRRDHPDRGTYTLQDKHKHDMHNLAEILHREFPITVFYPKFQTFSKKQKRKALEWLGDIYTSFHAFSYADENYKKSIQQNKACPLLLVKYFLGSKKLLKIVLFLRRIFRKTH